ncbi:MAG: hypothetical protein JJD98_10780 [Polaromonas sp.]|nr:hypothetical protein [Polaromonas sp.]
MFNLELGRSHRSQAVFPQLELFGQTQSIGDVGRVGLFGQSQQLLNFALEVLFQFDDVAV